MKSMNRCKMKWKKKQNYKNKKIFNLLSNKMKTCFTIKILTSKSSPYGILNKYWLGEIVISFSILELMIVNVQFVLQHVVNICYI